MVFRKTEIDFIFLVTDTASSISSSTIYIYIYIYVKTNKKYKYYTLRNMSINHPILNVDQYPINHNLPIRVLMFNYNIMHLFKLVA